MREKKISDNLLKKELKSGLSLNQIAKKYDMSVASIHQRVKRLGIKRRIKTMGKEWKKLSRNNKYGGRIVSLPSFYLKKIGLNTNKELFGRWLIEKGRLILEIEER